MSVEVKRAGGIFEADESPYKATALKAVKKMNFYKKSWFDIATEVWEALKNKHPEYHWYSICYSEKASCSL